MEPDEAGFTAFYEASIHRLVGQMHAMTGDRAEAQDCVQEAYARAWRDWSKVSVMAAPEAWVRQVAWRLAASRFRRAARGTGLLRGTRVEHVAPVGPDHVALVEALKQLPHAQRLAIVLHYVAGRSLEQIAEETDAPLGTVKARLSRGRKALADLLDDADHPDPQGATRE